MADSRDITGKNRKFKGTGSIIIPKGTQAQRVGGESGELRFNTDTNLAEYYDGTGWKPIDSPPTITSFTLDGGSSVTSATIDDEAAGAASIVLTGTSFDTTAGVVTFIPETTGSTINTQSITRTNANSFTVTVTRSDFTEANGPYTLRLANGSGLAATLSSAITADQASPTFTTNADTNLGTVIVGAVNPTLTTAAATDSDGTTVTHSVTSGSLPPGLSMASNGSITGTVGSISSSTNYTFTVTATDGDSQSATRQFVITGTPPAFMAATGGTITTNGDYKVHTFTSSGTFTVTGLGADGTYGSKVEYLVVAGGAGGGFAGHGAGGGAGGYRHNSAYNFTVAAQGYSITVGSYGGNQAGGGTSTFSNITSAGGGSGGHNGSNTGRGGGSGGGGAGHQGSGSGGSGNSPSVSPSQGSNGGSGQDGSPSYGSGGGGGASSAGQNGTSSNSPGGGNGGNGSANDIHGSSRTYSAGGGGHGHGNPGAGGSGGLGGNDNSAAGGRNTSNNYGMGGGGLNNNASSGVVVIRYKFQ